MFTPENNVRRPKYPFGRTIVQVFEAENRDGNGSFVFLWTVSDLRCPHGCGPFCVFFFMLLLQTSSVLLLQFHCNYPLVSLQLLCLSYSNTHTPTLLLFCFHSTKVLVFLASPFFFFLWVFHLLDFLTLFHCQWITRIKEELTLQVLFLLHFSLKGHCAHPHPLFFLHFLLHLSPFLSMFHYYIISLSGFCWFGVFLMKSLCLSGVSGFGNYVCVLFEVF